METFEASKDLDRLKEIYFRDERRRIILHKGETLLDEGSFNDRLFFILDGKMSGYLADENGHNVKVFNSSRNMFVGVYSFFSPEHRSYLTVKADTATTVAFIEQKDMTASPERFACDFLPVIIHEVYLRQLLAQQLTDQRQAAIKKLYENEKMATLGQLAAGLAHELNNAVGVMQRNTTWLIDSLSQYLKSKKLNSLFENSVKYGMTLDTRQLRKRRKSLEESLHIPAGLARQLAKINLTEQEIASKLENKPEALESITLISEAGFVLHDMQLAASHATHVVQSVRELGFANSGQMIQTSVYESINKALALLKSILTNVSIEFRKDTDGLIFANPGDLVQLWLNIIKNACESMSSSQTSHPGLGVQLSERGEWIVVEIKDNGPGITPELMSRVFEPNFTTKVPGLSFGLGLGLSIVNRIVLSYKGIISVKSKPGETVFTISLPRLHGENLK
jgi:signal transduction histidine kinase